MPFLYLKTRPLLDANEGCVDTAQKMEIFAVEEKPLEIVSSVAEDMEASTFIASSLPELKRASSVPIGITSLSEKRLLSSARQSLKIQLPSFDLFRTPSLIRGSYTAPAKSLTIPQGDVAKSSPPRILLNSQTLKHPGSIPLLTPPDDTVFNSHQVLSYVTEDHPGNISAPSINLSADPINPNLQVASNSQPISRAFIPDLPASTSEVHMLEVGPERAENVDTSPSFGSQDVGRISPWLDPAVNAACKLERDCFTRRGVLLNESQYQSYLRRTVLETLSAFSHTLFLALP